MKKVTTISDAYGLSLDIFKKLFPILVSVFFVLGVVFLFILPDYVIVGLLLIGVGLFLALCFTIFTILLKKKQAEQLEKEKQEKLQQQLIAQEAIVKEQEQLLQEQLLQEQETPTRSE